MAYTTIDDPSAHFHIETWTGTSDDSTKTVTNNANAGDFKPDWLWIKARSGTYGSGRDHALFDTSRGVDKRIETSSVDVEASTDSNNTFNTNGFTLTANYSINGPSTTYVGWQWKAGGSTPTKTYKVVVVSDSGNKYRFRNSSDTATFAQSAVTLDLQEGGTYVFDWSDSTAQGHPIRFSTTSDGTHGGGSEYTTGVVKDDSSYKTTITIAASAPQLYYYCSNHSGMGGTAKTNASHGQTNFDGSLLSVPQVNTDAGFSIISYEGNFDTMTIGHGLSQAPEALIIKNREHTNTSWVIYHKGLNFPTDDLIYFNTNAANQHNPTFNNTAPTSSVITMGAYSFNNRSGDFHVCYAFHSVKGYSKFGSYTANGNVDGPFVYTGFKPAWVMYKQTNSSDTAHWLIFDSKRSPTNVIGDDGLAANLNEAEGLSSWGPNTSDSVVDFVSNGFKIRTTATSGFNISGNTMIYMAFAEHPFVSSKGVPVTAR